MPESRIFFFPVQGVKVPVEIKRAPNPLGDQSHANYGDMWSRDGTTSTTIGIVQAIGLVFNYEVAPNGTTPYCTVTLEGALSLTDSSNRAPNTANCAPVTVSSIFNPAISLNCYAPPTAGAATIAQLIVAATNNELKNIQWPAPYPAPRPASAPASIPAPATLPAPYPVPPPVPALKARTVTPSLLQTITKSLRALSRSATTTHDPKPSITSTPKGGTRSGISNTGSVASKTGSRSVSPPTQPITDTRDHTESRWASKTSTLGNTASASIRRSGSATPSDSETLTAARTRSQSAPPSRSALVSRTDSRKPASLTRQASETPRDSGTVSPTNTLSEARSSTGSGTGFLSRTFRSIANTFTRSPTKLVGPAPEPLQTPVPVHAPRSGPAPAPKAGPAPAPKAIATKSPTGQASLSKTKGRESRSASRVRSGTQAASGTSSPLSASRPATPSQAQSATASQQRLSHTARTQTPAAVPAPVSQPIIRPIPMRVPAPQPAPTFGPAPAPTSAAPVPAPGVVRTGTTSAFASFTKTKIPGSATHQQTGSHITRSVTPKVSGSALATASHNGSGTASKKQSVSEELSASRPKTPTGSGRQTTTQQGTGSQDPTTSVSIAAPKTESVPLTTSRRGTGTPSDELTASFRQTGTRPQTPTHTGKQTLTARGTDSHDPTNSVSVAAPETKSALPSASHRGTVSPSDELTDSLRQTVSRPQTPTNTRRETLTPQGTGSHDPTDSISTASREQSISDGPTASRPKTPTGSAKQTLTHQGTGSHRGTGTPSDELTTSLEQTGTRPQTPTDTGRKTPTARRTGSAELTATGRSESPSASGRTTTEPVRTKTRLTGTKPRSDTDSISPSVSEEHSATATRPRSPTRPKTPTTPTREGRSGSVTGERTRTGGTPTPPLSRSATPVETGSVPTDSAAQTGSVSDEKRTGSASPSLAQSKTDKASRSGTPEPTGSRAKPSETRAASRSATPFVEPTKFQPQNRSATRIGSHTQTIIPTRTLLPAARPAIGPTVPAAFDSSGAGLYPLLVIPGVGVALTLLFLYGPYRRAQVNDSETSWKGDVEAVVSPEEAAMLRTVAEQLGADIRQLAGVAKRLEQSEETTDSKQTRGELLIEARRSLERVIVELLEAVGPDSEEARALKQIEAELRAAIGPEIELEQGRRNLGKIKEELAELIAPRIALEELAMQEVMISLTGASEDLEAAIGPEVFLAQVSEILEHASDGLSDLADIGPEDKLDRLDLTRDLLEEAKEKLAAVSSPEKLILSEDDARYAQSLLRGVTEQLKKTRRQLDPLTTEFAWGAMATEPMWVGKTEVMNQDAMRRLIEVVGIRIDPNSGSGFAPNSIGSRELFAQIVQVKTLAKEILEDNPRISSDQLQEKLLKIVKLSSTVEFRRARPEFVANQASDFRSSEALKKSAAMVGNLPVHRQTIIDFVDAYRMAPSRSAHGETRVTIGAGRAPEPRLATPEEVVKQTLDHQQKRHDNPGLIERMLVRPTRAWSERFDSVLKRLLFVPRLPLPKKEPRAAEPDATKEEVAKVPTDAVIISPSDVTPGRRNIAWRLDGALEAGTLEESVTSPARMAMLRAAAQLAAVRRILVELRPGDETAELGGEAEAQLNKARKELISNLIRVAERTITAAEENGDSADDVMAKLREAIKDLPAVDDSRYARLVQLLNEMDDPVPAPAPPSPVPTEEISGTLSAGHQTAETKLAQIKHILVTSRLNGEVSEPGGEDIAQLVKEGRELVPNFIRVAARTIAEAEENGDSADDVMAKLREAIKGLPAIKDSGYARLVQLLGDIRNSVPAPASPLPIPTEEISGTLSAGHQTAETKLVVVKRILVTSRLNGAVFHLGSEASAQLGKEGKERMFNLIHVAERTIAEAEKNKDSADDVMAKLREAIKGLSPVEDDSAYAKLIAQLLGEIGHSLPAVPPLPPAPPEEAPEMAAHSTKHQDAIRKLDAIRVLVASLETDEPSGEDEAQPGRKERAELVSRLINVMALGEKNNDSAEVTVAKLQEVINDSPEIKGDEDGRYAELINALKGGSLPPVPPPPPPASYEVFQEISEAVLVEKLRGIIKDSPAIYNDQKLTNRLLEEISCPVPGAPPSPSVPISEVQATSEALLISKLHEVIKGLPEVSDDKEDDQDNEYAEFVKHLLRQIGHSVPAEAPSAPVRIAARADSDGTESGGKSAAGAPQSAGGGIPAAPTNPLSAVVAAVQPVVESGGSGIAQRYVERAPSPGRASPSTRYGRVEIVPGTGNPLSSPGRQLRQVGTPPPHSITQSSSPTIAQAGASTPFSRKGTLAAGAGVAILQRGSQAQTPTPRTAGGTARRASVSHLLRVTAQPLPPPPPSEFEQRGGPEEAMRLFGEQPAPLGQTAPLSDEMAGMPGALGTPLAPHPEIRPGDDADSDEKTASEKRSPAPDRRPSSVWEGPIDAASPQTSKAGSVASKAGGGAIVPVSAAESRAASPTKEPTPPGSGLVTPPPGQVAVSASPPPRDFAFRRGGSPSVDPEDLPAAAVRTRVFTRIEVTGVVNPVADQIYDLLALVEAQSEAGPAETLEAAHRRRKIVKVEAEERLREQDPELARLLENDGAQALVEAFNRLGETTDPNSELGRLLNRISEKEAPDVDEIVGVLVKAVNNPELTRRYEEEKEARSDREIARINVLPADRKSRLDDLQNELKRIREFEGDLLAALKPPRLSEAEVAPEATREDIVPAPNKKAKPRGEKGSRGRVRRKSKNMAAIVPTDDADDTAEGAGVIVPTDGDMADAVAGEAAPDPAQPHEVTDDVPTAPHDDNEAEIEKDHERFIRLIQVKQAELEKIKAENRGHKKKQRQTEAAGAAEEETDISGEKETELEAVLAQALAKEIKWVAHRRQIASEMTELPEDSEQRKTLEGLLKTERERRAAVITEIRPDILRYKLLRELRAELTTMESAAVILDETYKGFTLIPVQAAAERAAAAAPAPVEANPLVENRQRIVDDSQKWVRLLEFKLEQLAQVESSTRLTIGQVGLKGKLAELLERERAQIKSKISAATEAAEADTGSPEADPGKVVPRRELGDMLEAQIIRRNEALDAIGSIEVNNPEQLEMALDAENTKHTEAEEDISAKILQIQQIFVKAAARRADAAASREPAALAPSKMQQHTDLPLPPAARFDSAKRGGIPRAQSFASPAPPPNESPERFVRRTPTREPGPSHGARAGNPPAHAVRPLALDATGPVEGAVPLVSPIVASTIRDLRKRIERHSAQRAPTEGENPTAHHSGAIAAAPVVGSGSAMPTRDRRSASLGEPSRVPMPPRVPAFAPATLPLAPANSGLRDASEASLYSGPARISTAPNIPRSASGLRPPLSGRGAGEPIGAPGIARASSASRLISFSPQPPATASRDSASAPRALPPARTTGLPALALRLTTSPIPSPASRAPEASTARGAPGFMPGIGNRPAIASELGSGRIRVPGAAPANINLRPGPNPRDGEASRLRPLDRGGRGSSDSDT